MLTKKVIEDLSQFLRPRKVEKLLSQVQLVVGSVQTIFIKRKILGNRSSSQLIILVPMQEYPGGQSIGEHTDHLRLNAVATCIFDSQPHSSFRFVLDIIHSQKFFLDSNLYPVLNQIVYQTFVDLV